MPMDRQFFENFSKQLEYNKCYINDIIKNFPKEKDNVTYSRQLNAMCEIENGICVNPNLIFDLIYPNKVKIGQTKPIRFFSKYIDKSQGLAVQKALAMDNLLVIQGPPGAGKTTTITEIIKQLKNQQPNSKILITSQSHIAVDNVIKKLSLEGLAENVVRAYSNEKSLNDIKKYSVEKVFDSVIKNSDEKFKKVLESYNQKQEDGTMQNSFLRHNSKDLILSKDIIGVTINSVANCRFGMSGVLDYAIIDEVGKCSFSEVLMIAQMCKKLILIGDERQLPAVMEQFSENCSYNKEGYDYITENPFIEQVFTNINPDCKVFLNYQYRMSDAIGCYISENFYDSKLLNGVGNNNVYVENALNFVDYDPRGYEVKSQFVKEKMTTVLANDREIEIVKLLLKTELKDVPYKNILIIAPYLKQIQNIKAKLPDFPTDNINTIDAFQGSERDYVIFSCVRNFGRPTLFFSKKNRLNVAISRSIRKVYLVGAKKYISQVPYLNNYINFDKKIKDKNGNEHNCKCNVKFYNGQNLV